MNAKPVTKVGLVGMFTLAAASAVYLIYEVIMDVIRSTSYTSW